MIVVVPKNTVTEEERLIMIEKGYVVLQVDNPEHVRIINPESPVDSNSMVMAALKALSNTMTDSASKEFVQELYKRLKAIETSQSDNTNKGE